ncbi:hypothetical protein KUTeg_004770 [Tegillarca granosa]|uniref:Uncharacterized protein n=1 Tax=Tegillarca granosa TaxID=220873 RepID=A0ABQ9FHT4_TEGGR|nr:hypothetical protein KUTeg_004770 [Tegillarca granosa]
MSLPSFIGSLFSFLQFLASPVVGAASDVYGRRPVLIVSMVMCVCVCVCVCVHICPDWCSIFHWFCIWTIDWCNVFSLGEGAGRYILCSSSTICTRISIARCYIYFIMFKETLPEKKRAKSISTGWQNTSHLINPVSLFKFSSVSNLSPEDLKGIQKIGSVYFLYLLLYSGLEFTLTFLAHHRLHYDSMQQGKMFFFIGVIMATVQGGYVRRIKAGSELKITTMGMVILIPAFIIMAFAHSAALMYLGLALFSFVYWSFGDKVCYITGGILIIIPYLLLKTVKQRND